MATDVLNEYRSGANALPESYRLWPLYGAGLENLGKDGAMLEVPLVHPGPDELLIRHAARQLVLRHEAPWRRRERVQGRAHAGATRPGVRGRLAPAPQRRVPGPLPVDRRCGRHWGLTPPGGK